MTFLATELVVMVALVVSSSGAEGTKMNLGYLPKSHEFQVVRQEDIKDGPCISTVFIVGKNFTDKIEYYCRDDKHRYTRVDDSVVIIDDVIYSDQPNSLVVRIGESCQQKIYGKGRVRRTFLTGTDCIEVMKKLDKREPVNTIFPPLSPSSSVTNPTYQTVHDIAVPEDTMSSAVNPISETVNNISPGVNPISATVNTALPPLSPSSSVTNPTYQTVHAIAVPEDTMFSAVKPISETVNNISSGVNPISAPVNTSYPPLSPSSSVTNPTYQTVNAIAVPEDTMSSALNPISETVNNISSGVNPIFTPVNNISSPVNPPSRPMNTISYIPPSWFPAWLKKYLQILWTGSHNNGVNRNVGGNVNF